MRAALGLAVAAGLTSGVVMVSVIDGGTGMLLAYAAPLPLVLIGLAFGMRFFLLAMTVGGLVVGTVAASALPAFLVIGVTPALLLSVTALKRRPTGSGEWRWSEPGEILVGLAFGAVLMMSLVALVRPVDGKSIADMLRDQVAPFIEAWLPSASSEVRASILDWWVALLPSMVGVGWMMMAMLNGLVGQWAVSHAGHALRPTPDYARLHLPMGLGWAAGAAELLGLVGGDFGYMARNTAILLLAPFLLAGLAEIHLALRPKPQARLGLALFYGAFFALFGWAALAVTAWGLVRQGLKSDGGNAVEDTKPHQENQ